MTFEMDMARPPRQKWQLQLQERDFIKLFLLPKESLPRDDPSRKDIPPEDGWLLPKDIQKLGGHYPEIYPRPHKTSGGYSRVGKILIPQSNTSRIRLQLRERGILEVKLAKKRDKHRRESDFLAMRLRQDDKGFQVVYLFLRENALLPNYDRSHYSGLTRMVREGYASHLAQLLTEDKELASAMGMMADKWFPDLFFLFLLYPSSTEKTIEQFRKGWIGCGGVGESPTIRGIVVAHTVAYQVFREFENMIYESKMPASKGVHLSGIIKSYLKNKHKEEDKGRDS